MTDLSRRDMLGLLGLAVMSGAFGCTADGVEKAAREVRKACEVRNGVRDAKDAGPERSVQRVQCGSIGPRTARSPLQVYFC